MGVLVVVLGVDVYQFQVVDRNVVISGSWVVMKGFCSWALLLVVLLDVVVVRLVVVVLVVMVVVVVVVEVVLVVVVAVVVIEDSLDVGGVTVNKLSQSAVAKCAATNMLPTLF